MSCYRREADGIVLAVRLTPRANRDSVDGIGTLSDGQQVALARVRAVPEDGAANVALMALIARTFGRPKAAITLLRGATQRVKHVQIAGVPEQLAAIVDSWPVK
jgi:uncharacterized protein YggU (UPF0235/DUF167 family)